MARRTRDEKRENVTISFKDDNSKRERERERTRERENESDKEGNIKTKQGKIFFHS